METIDYRVESFYDNGRHFVRGFLVGTKPTELGEYSWKLSKKTLAEKVKQFKNKIPIIAVPDLLQKSPREGHIFANTYQELLEAQKPATRGNSFDIQGPFSYEDGTDDEYYKFKGEITDKPVSEALAAGTLPYNVSPYVWPKINGELVDPKTLSNRMDIEDWVPVHIAIVKEGAYGWRAALDKQCLGSEEVCHSALAASSIETAETISSQLLSQPKSPSYMSANETQNLQGPVGNTNEVPQVNNAPVKAPDTNIKTQGTSQISVEEFTKLQESLAAQTKVNEKLVLRHKTETLNKIFGNIADESEKAKIIKKWIGNEDVDILADFHNDILSYAIPKVKEDKPTKTALAASGGSEEEEEDCGCGKKKTNTKFPIAGSSNSGTSRLNRERSLTEIFGGAITQ